MLVNFVTESLQVIMIKQRSDTEQLGDILLEIGSLMMSSGANSMRIRVTIMRIANAFGYQTELLITHRALMITISNSIENQTFNNFKRTSPHGVNFKLVSGISKMSWNIVSEKWTLEQIRGELDRLKALPHFPRLIILTFVSLAGLSFCRLFGGNITEMLITFSATFIGLFVRQEAMKKSFNPYLCIFFAALTSSLISGLAVKMSIGENPEFSFATSVLYLIPGVPLINSFSDLIDGNIMNGIMRLTNGMIIAFAIAIGLAIPILIYHI